MKKHSLIFQVLVYCWFKRSVQNIRNIKDVPRKKTTTKKQYHVHSDILKTQTKHNPIIIYKTKN